MRIFFAGPLTNLSHPETTKAFYDRLAQAAQNHGFDSFLAFRSGTDPIKNPGVAPSAVYQVDTAELAKSDFVVAYVGEPSTGTGIEIEYARQHNIPVYLLYEKGKVVSRMLRGEPNVKGEIVYEDEADALAQFEALLATIK